MLSSFYSKEEIKSIGFKAIGKNTLISKKASFYGPENISIGDNCRIDDFCILSGSITLGNHVHISAGAYLFGGEAGIIFGDFSGISSRGAVYAITDDYSGEYMTNPTVPMKLRNVICKKVVIGKHVVIGTGSTVLPGVSIGDYSAVGSMSLVNKSLGEKGIFFGIPAKKYKDRLLGMIDLEKDCLFGKE